MTDLLKSWAKNGFSVEINTTHCGSLAYKVSDNDQEIFRNNNFYPSIKAKSDLDSDLIIFELIKTLEVQTKRLDDYQMSYVSQKNRDWIKSERFQEFVNLIPNGVLNEKIF